MFEPESNAVCFGRQSDPTLPQAARPLPLPKREQLIEPPLPPPLVMLLPVKGPLLMGQVVLLALPRFVYMYCFHCFFSAGVIFIVGMIAKPAYSWFCAFCTMVESHV